MKYLTVSCHFIPLRSTYSPELPIFSLNACMFYIMIREICQVSVKAEYAVHIFPLYKENQTTVLFSVKQKATLDVHSNVKIY
jgi:hypothetical protein